MNSRVTQSDIARKAGVHPTTVSLALRNHPSLPAKTRERIQAIAAEMGYRPDPDLRSLMLYRRRMQGHANPATLAYVTNWSTRWGWKDAPAHLQFFDGAAAKAAQLGYRLEHFWLGEPGLSPQRMSDIFLARGIPGVIIASHQPNAGKSLSFEWQHFSAVKIDFFPAEPELHNVTNDQAEIVRLALRHVLDAGYRRIGFVIPGWFDHFVDHAWSAGFLVEQQRIDAKDRLPILFFGTPPFEDPRSPTMDPVPVSEFAAWYRKHKPDALISWRPFLLPRLAEMGLSIPRDIAYADIYLEETDGRTAGVRQNCRRVGELALELLAGQLQQHIAGIPEFPTTSLVEGTWFDGATLPRRIPAAGLART